MMQIEIDASQLQALKQAIEGTRKSLPQEYANAINKTSTKVRTLISKNIRAEINLKAKDLKKFLKIRGRASKTRLSASVRLDYQKRPGVGGKDNRFNPKQNTKGTGFKVSKKKGKTFLPHAFMGPRPGMKALKLHGGVFIRKNTGDPRSKIQKVYAVSPWAAYIKNNMDPEIHRATTIELRKQIDSRIRTILKQKQLT